jgi:hypothetical protein
VKRPYKAFVKWLMESPFHVLICGREKNVFEEDKQTGDLKKVGVTMNAEKDTAYEPQACIRLVPKVDPSDPTKTTYFAYVEKDRTGMLAGRTLANLTWKHFAPVVGLLGGEQSKMEDPEVVAARDAEHMEKAEQETQDKKYALSQRYLAEYSKRIAEAKKYPDLTKIGAELKAKRNSLLDSHSAVLREAYAHKSTELEEKEKEKTA